MSRLAQNRLLLAGLAAVLVVAVVVTVVLVAASGDDEPPRAAPRPTPTTATPTPTPTPTPTKAKPRPPQRSLLSGRFGRKDGPVYAVKIDNTGKSHPQVGLDAADVVYIEQVEGGATRLAAVYSSRYPRRVGPVRSARITDIELLRQYGENGRVGLIYSGSQRRLDDNLRRSPMKLVSYDKSNRGFTRGGRPKPYDVMATFSTMRARAGRVERPTRVGYSFGALPRGGKRARHVEVRYPLTRVDATWSARQGRWLLSMDGRPDLSAAGTRLGPTTFVVQYGRISRSPYRDVNGAVTPETHTVGHGRALFFRDGRVFDGRWVRERPRQPTQYFFGGRRAVLDPGQVWIALVGRTSPVRID